MSAYAASREAAVSFDMYVSRSTPCWSTAAAPSPSSSSSVLPSCECRAHPKRQSAAAGCVNVRLRSRAWRGPCCGAAVALAAWQAAAGVVALRATARVQRARGASRACGQSSAQHDGGCSSGDQCLPTFMPKPSNRRASTSMSHSTLTAVCRVSPMILS
eukprot:5624015-Prymnesium_polylepis.2